MRSLFFHNDIHIVAGWCSTTSRKIVSNNDTRKMKGIKFMKLTAWPFGLHEKLFFYCPSAHHQPPATAALLVNSDYVISFRSSNNGKNNKKSPTSVFVCHATESPANRCGEWLFGCCYTRFSDLTYLFMRVALWRHTYTHTHTHRSLSIVVLGQATTMCWFQKAAKCQINKKHKDQT